MTKIGIIGYRKHAEELITILERNPHCTLQYIYHPNKTINDDRGTNDFTDLLRCDAVIIASPNHTHFEYIEKLLQNPNLFIFCEKPPISSHEELKQLKKINEQDKKRIFFNFMFRFSKLNEIFKEYLVEDKIGKLIRVDVVFTKGLAFKDKYLGSWRADGENNLHNILDASTIHFIDLFNTFLKKSEKHDYFPELISERGTSFDTTFTVLKYKKVILSILNSYASPLVNEVTILGTNGYLTIRDGRIVFFSPRDTFDSKGYFIKPPIQIDKEYSIENDIENAMSNSMNYFIEHVKEKNEFSIELFNASMETNRVIIELKEN